ncbi:hypothetical protein [Anatilimnocola floriformis]|uniref:hypothetical protein n=1 Tax=Anatilimnocola floriformis TaxID=2948575 RepID=UPI0020C1D479|nr:hypothetical protein [Anatilimnocola floriformis]
MTHAVGKFVSQIQVLPHTALGLVSRTVGQFSLTSIDDATVEASSSEASALQEFRSSVFMEKLEQLAWDLVWEQQVAVLFEPALGGNRTLVNEQGQQVVEIHLEDRIEFNPENPRVGLEPYTHFDLLQQIRDHVIKSHLATGNALQATKLQGNAAILLAVEHFVKGVVNRQYALAEFYSVYETIAHQWAGGKAALKAHMTPSKLEKITKIANDGQLDLRHPPKDPTAVAALPPNAIEDAAVVAKEIIVEYAKGIV